MSSKTDFEKVLQLYGPQVTEQVKVFTPKDLRVPLLFRLDERVPKRFVPRMPASAGSTENSTVPRVVTATTLFGCMSGHAAMIWLIKDRRVGEDGNNHYKISAFEFEYGLFPSKKLVYDAEDTKEAWLLAYDKSTIDYVPINYGELFFHQVAVTIQPNSVLNKQIVTILVHIDDERGVEWCEGVFLEKGYYFIKADATNYALGIGKGTPKRTTVFEKDKFEILPITRELYKSYREISVKKKG